MRQNGGKILKYNAQLLIKRIFVRSFHLARQLLKNAARFFQRKETTTATKLMQTSHYVIGISDRYHDFDALSKVPKIFERRFMCLFFCFFF